MVSVNLVHDVFSTVSFGLLSVTDVLQCLLELVLVEGSAVISVICAENPASFVELLLLEGVDSHGDGKGLAGVVRTTVLELVCYEHGGSRGGYHRGAHGSCGTNGSSDVAWTHAWLRGRVSRGTGGGISSLLWVSSLRGISRLAGGRVSGGGSPGVSTLRRGSGVSALRRGATGVSLRGRAAGVSLGGRAAGVSLRGGAGGAGVSLRGSAGLALSGVGSTLGGTLRGVASRITRGGARSTRVALRSSVGGTRITLGCSVGGS